MSHADVRTRLAVAIAIFLAISVAVACAGSPSASGGHSNATGSPAANGSIETFAGPELTVDATIDVLAKAGVSVYGETTDTNPITAAAAPVSPFALLRFQVDNLVRDANAGGGISSSLIDDLIPMPEDAIPFSAILAGYVATATTPGGRFSAELMADQDLSAVEQLWFPTITLALFVGETSGAAKALAESGGLGTRGAATTTHALTVAQPGIQLAAFDPCAQFSNWFADMLKSVSDAILSVVPRIPFIGAAIEWALKGLAGLTVDAVNEILGHLPWLEPLKIGVKALAIAVTVAAALRDWPVTVTGDPAAAHHSVGFTVNHVTVTAKVDDGPGDVIPDAVRSCATLLSVTLPKGGAAGSAVAWRVVAGGYHMLPGSSEKVLPPSKLVRFNFDMVDEPERNHADGQPKSGPIQVAVTVHRQDVAQMEALIKGMITSQIPTVIWDAIVGLTGDPIKKLTSWTDPTGSGKVTAGYHEEPTPSPTPSETPPPSDSPSPSVSASPDKKDEFCKRYLALVAWGQDPPVEELSQAWSRYVAYAYTDMRPFAPANIVPGLDRMISAYNIHGRTNEPFNVPAAGPDAVFIGETVLAIHEYCGIPIY